MTTFEWAMLIIAGAGFLITAGTVIVAVTRGVENIKQDTTEKIGSLRTEVGRERQEILDRFAEEQKSQDSHFGEMGNALRRYIETVEKEMHRIELWGRDNYVKQPDFERAIDAIRQDFRALGNDIKKDFRDVFDKIDARAEKE